MQSARLALATLAVMALTLVVLPGKALGNPVTKLPAQAPVTSPVHFSTTGTQQMNIK